MASPGKYRVLITGISGFTGRHLANSLSEHGWDIVGLGDTRLPLESDHLDADLADTDRLGDWIGHVCPTHIVHLAALSHVVGDPLSFYRVNVLGTESLLEAVSNSGIAPAKVVIASSANIYGNAQQSPISENSPVRPVNHYALSKAAMELLVEKWFGKMPIVLTRPFNYTGPGQSEAFVFPKIVAAFKRGDAVLRLGNLNVARDISDVGFVCEAYRRLLVSDVHSERVNVCSGQSVALLSVLDTMAEIAGYRPRIEVDPAFVRKEEILDLRGDPSKLFAQIGHLEPWPLGKILRRMFIAKVVEGQR
jgi:nucleoside-diphosphate-sugar epimerase